MIKTITSRAARTALMGLLVVGLGACTSFDNLLEVQNPEELNEELLQNPALIEVLANSAVGDLEEALDDPFIWRGSMMTDETLTGINWEQTARLNQRITSFGDGDPDFMFTEISRARQQADSVAGRFRTLLTNPTSDERMAKVLAYAGYAYVLLADAMCEATVNVSSEIYQPLDLYQFAVTRFEEALTVAQAAGNQDLVNLARVGLTRAHLHLGNASQVMSIAQQVPADFRWYAEYDGSNPAVYNVLESRVNGVNHSLGVAPRFVAGGATNFGTQNVDADLTDPRVQHLPSWRLGHNQLTPLYTPFAPLMFSNHNGQTIAGGGSPAEIERGSDIAFASGLEAMHNMYEATGPTAATLAFVNARRAAGNQAAVNLSGDDLMAELRMQRGKDLFLAGYRIGDLRRWLRAGIDLFPSGTHVNEQWGSYGSATCFPLPLEEYEGNPNIPVPGS